ncbi:hypothetical protein ACTFIZ_012735 [Dictyostelium cf. discoideum]
MTSTAPFEKERKTKKIKEIAKDHHVKDNNTIDHHIRVDNSHFMEWVNELKYTLNEVINIIRDKEKSIITIYKLFKEIKKKKLFQGSDFKIYDPNIWLISYDSTLEL